MKLTDIASILAIISGILNGLLAVYVYKRAVKNTANRFFVILTFVTAVWAFVNAYYLRFTWYPFINLSYGVGIFVPLLILIWISEFTQRKLSRFKVSILTTITVAVSILTLIPNLTRTYGFEQIQPKFP